MCPTFNSAFESCRSGIADDELIFPLSAGRWKFNFGIMTTRRDNLNGSRETQYLHAFKRNSRGRMVLPRKTNFLDIRPGDVITSRRTHTRRIHVYPARVYASGTEQNKLKKTTWFVAHTCIYIVNEH